jgi:non-specific serine/threonine protein kinase/serine/threonine-protein kinase
MHDAAATRAEEIFHASLELDHAERGRFVAAQCGGDAALRDTVEELLSAHEAAGPFLGQPIEAWRVADALRSGGHDEPEEAFLLERYRLVERIGEGGMGVVWRAEQVVGVRRMVAIKIVKGSFATAEVLGRFETERQALARLNHPHIAKVLDAGATSTGRPFFVMELVAGRPLLAFCDEQALPIAARLRLFLQVCDAIRHAHQKGIIHRDLKPSNILVEPPAGAPVAKVIDFGLAKAVDEESGDSPRTMVGVRIGTPAYMSPEQTMLGAQDIDTRTDVFSLGVLLYELLTGTTPLPRETLAGLSLDASFAAVRDNEPPPPSMRLRRLSDRLAAIAAQRSAAPDQLVAAVRGDLDAICSQALAKERERRYQDVGELAADVERSLRDEPVLARPPTARYRIGKFVRRRRLAVGLAAGLGFALIAGTAISLTLMFRARESEADLAAFAAFLTEDVLAAARPREVEGGLGVNITVRDALVAANDKLPERFAGRAQAEAITRHTLGRTFFNLGEYARATAQMERTCELQRKTLGERDPKTLSTMVPLGRLYANAGRSKEAIALIGEALAGQTAVLGPDHVETIETMATFGNLFLGSEPPDLPRAVAIGEQALERASRALGAEARHTWFCMRILGRAYAQTGRFAEAVGLQDYVLAKLRAIYPVPNGYTVLVMSDLGFAHMGARQFDQAIQLHGEAVELMKAQLGEERPLRLAAMNNLADAYLAKEDFAAAEATARACVELRTKTLGAIHSDTRGSEIILVQSLLAQGQHAAAERISREFLPAQEQAAPGDWRTHASQLALAEALLGLHRGDEAIALLETAIARLEPIRTRIPLFVVTIDQSLARIARLHTAQGDAARAARWEARRAEWTEWDVARRRELATAGRGAAAVAPGGARP